MQRILRKGLTRWQENVNEAMIYGAVGDISHMAELIPSEARDLCKEY